MVWSLAFLLVVVAGVMYVFFAPFYLEINSDDGTYRVRFHWVAAAYIIPANNTLVVKLQILGWQKQFDVFTSIKKREKPKVAIKETKKKKSVFSLVLVRDVLKTFQVNKCIVLFDTGDMPLNGILYPVLYWLSRKTGKTLQITFDDTNTIQLQIENNLARIAKAFIYSSLKNKKNGQPK